MRMWAGREGPTGHPCLLYSPLTAWSVGSPGRGLWTQSFGGKRSWIFGYKCQYLCLWFLTIHTQVLPLLEAEVCVLVCMCVCVCWGDPGREGG